jgi:hypothetical protein
MSANDMQISRARSKWLCANAVTSYFAKWISTSITGSIASARLTWLVPRQVHSLSTEGPAPKLSSYAWFLSLYNEPGKSLSDGTAELFPSFAADSSAAEHCYQLFSINEFSYFMINFRGKK